MNHKGGLDRPVFHVIGAGRGGTSLLASLLNMHPSVDVGFERYAQDILMNCEMPSDAVDPVEHRLGMYLAACSVDACASAALGRLWGNKITTEQIYTAILASDHHRVRVQSLDFFFNQLLADQLIVFILRDGRSCVSSKMNRAGLSLEEACVRWMFSVRCWELMGRRASPTLIIRFEDLVRHPVEVLKGICHQLGIAYQPTMLSGTTSEHLLPEYRQAGFDLSRLQEVCLPPFGEAMIRSDLLKTGYLMAAKLMG
jgi:hypothetical protein